MLGHCGKVRVEKELTVIVNGSGEKEAIDKRIGQIRGQI